MILVFGGTTEGRLAAEVCELAGKPYWYSTKGQGLDIPLLHGHHVQGAMDEATMKAFVRENDVRCVVNAAHPFASGLHKAMASLTLPVIRLQRKGCPEVEGATYFDSMDEALSSLTQHPTPTLLSLCGASSIEVLSPYWRTHHTVFRILRRRESIEKAKRCGLGEADLVFFNDEMKLPTPEEEVRLMREVGCTAVITKDTGSNGGFPAKAEAARSLGVDLLVIRPPRLPGAWTYVSGRHSLRRAIEQTVPDFFPLRTGLTTGTCATAAAKAALLSLLGKEPTSVSVTLPDGEEVSVATEIEGRGRASVVKDRSDDPDVTKGCRVWAEVKPRTDGCVHFLRGEGVGLVTLPGLGIGVGEAAINVVPRRMIEHEVKALHSGGADVRVGVEGGEELGKRTFNPRLGIEGGISIVGTSGIVSPLSHKAFVDSLRRELEVARAMSCREIAFVSGKRSEDSVRSSLGIRCVHCVNLIGETLSMAREMGCFDRIVVALMIGKAVKLAAGNLDTHSKSSSIDTPFLRSLAHECGTEAEPEGGWDKLVFARELWKCMPPPFFEKVKELCLHHCRTVYPTGRLEIMLVCEPEG